MIPEEFVLPIIVAICVLVFLPVYLLLEKWENKRRVFIIQDKNQTMIIKNESHAVGRCMNYIFNEKKNPKIIVKTRNGIIFQGTAYRFLGMCTVR
jgi:hypothetical protein